MKMKGNKSGFTLLEIIIVIIIVGVLASLALPKFFSTVEFSRSTEALNAIGAIRQSIERCFLMANTYSGCGDSSGFADIDIDDPGGASTHFTYDLSTGTWNASQFTIVATRTTLDGGSTGSTITFSRAAAGTFSKSGTGAFASIK